LVAFCIVGGIGIGRWSSTGSTDPKITLKKVPVQPVQATAIIPAATSLPPRPKIVAGKVDLNAATAAQLLLLPGIGPKRAADLIAERQARGAFKDMADVGRVPGFGPATLERLAPQVLISGRAAAAPTPVATGALTARNLVRINLAGASELETLDGVGPQLAARIITDRTQKGPYKRPRDLLRVKGLGTAFLTKNGARLNFD